MNTHENNQAPFGYRWDNGQLVHEESEQAIIKEIENLKAKGYTYKAIGDWMAQEGFITAREQDENVRRAQSEA